MSLKDHQNISKKYYRLFIHKSTFVNKLTFISIAFVHFLLPVLFRIEHENSCNDPLEIPWTVMRLAVNCPCFPMFQEITTITCALSQSFHPWFISCNCLWWKYLQSCHARTPASKRPRARGHWDLINTFFREGCCVNIPLVTVHKETHLNRRADLGNSNWFYDARFCFVGACPTNRCDRC